MEQKKIKHFDFRKNNNLKKKRIHKEKDLS